MKTLQKFDPMRTNLELVRERVLEITQVLASDNMQSAPHIVRYVQRELDKAEMFVACESYRKALWQVITSAELHWPDRETLCATRMRLIDVGGRALWAKVHNQTVTRWRKAGAPVTP